ncbi:Arc family DNA-binding protein [Rhizobium rhizogenes]|uniref:Arc family DNA-binding protein n=1 Tax=Rhizobium rhizogenes TaxID=359 RepID=UPI0015749650|nr:Arc family DNA-binding protein [Rhizobium rhizogenes]NTF80877.1 Arc family DNA-binding protein [Rhizobium rhizogenes]NTI74271.1 Arc family DNA-binding protein [Rhizobium rhizogenes]
MAINRSTPDQFQLRLPPGLRDKLKAEGETWGRSTNTEIVQRLEWSLQYSPEKIAELESEVVEQAAEISELEEAIAEKDDEIARLKEQVTFHMGMNKSLSEIVQTVIARADVDAEAVADMRDQLKRSSNEG